MHDTLELFGPPSDHQLLEMRGKICKYRERLVSRCMARLLLRTGRNKLLIRPEDRLQLDDPKSQLPFEVRNCDREKKGKSL